MSKAFTRESDDDAAIAVPRPASSLPPGAKNYITAGGERRLREELARLVEIDRPDLAARVASTDDPDFKRQLRALDQRIAQVEESLRSAVVVTPPADAQDTVKFGATVDVREKNGDVTRYRIVGVDETDVDQGWVSWVSPIARALLNARVGQKVQISLPSGADELEIVGVSYDDPAQ